MIFSMFVKFYFDEFQIDKSGNPKEKLVFRDYSYPGVEINIAISRLIRQKIYDRFTFIAFDDKLNVELTGHIFCRGTDELLVVLHDITNIELRAGPCIASGVQTVKKFNRKIRRL